MTNTEIRTNHDATTVVITDIQMPFTSMVLFMVKWAFASIPAIVIIALIAGGVSLLGGAFIGALSGHSSSVSGSNSQLPSRDSAPAAPIVYGTTASMGGTTSSTSASGAEQSSSGVPDRCKYSSEMQKCIDLERALQRETPEERRRRIEKFEASRAAAMEKVRKQ